MGQGKMLCMNGVSAGSDRELWGLNGPELSPFALAGQAFVFRVNQRWEGVGSLTSQGHPSAKGKSQEEETAFAVAGGWVHRPGKGNLNRSLTESITRVLPHFCVTLRPGVMWGILGSAGR